MNLEGRLRDRFAQASEALPGPALDWGETYNRARRGRTIYLAAVAFGTSVVLAAGGLGAWTMLEGRDGGRVPLPPTSTESPPTAEPSPTPPADPGPEKRVSFEEPFRSVESFLQAALEGGHPEVMWAEMTNFSRAVYDHDFQRFREAASEIQEGWGSWGAAGDLSKHWQDIASSGDGAIGVVTLLGSRTAEGYEEPYAAAAIPVRIDAEGKAKLELFVTRGLFEFQVPRDLTAEQPPGLDRLAARDISFDVLVPATASRVYMVVAPVPDEPAFSAYGEATIENVDADQVRAGWAPDEQLFSGEWFLTVVAVYGDGSMQADSVRFLIE